MFYFQGFELREISERLNEPLGNVRHHFYISRTSKSCAKVLFVRRLWGENSRYEPWPGRVMTTSDSGELSCLGQRRDTKLRRNLQKLHGHLQSCRLLSEKVYDQYRFSLGQFGIPELVAIHSSGARRNEVDDTATRREVASPRIRNKGNRSQ